MRSLTVLLLATTLTAGCFGGSSSSGGDGDGDGGDGDGDAVLTGDGDGDGGDGDGDSNPPPGMGSGSSIVPSDTALEEVTEEQLDMLCIANEANIAALNDDAIRCTREALGQAEDVESCEELEASCQDMIQVDPDDETCGQPGEGDGGDGPPMECPITVQELEGCIAEYAAFLRALSCDDPGGPDDEPGCLAELMANCMDLFDDGDEGGGGNGGNNGGPAVMCGGEIYNIGRDLDCQQCGTDRCCDLYTRCIDDQACGCVNRCLNEGGGDWDYEGCHTQCGFDPGRSSLLFDEHENCLRERCDSECR